MTRRCLSVWLPHWPTDRFRRRGPAEAASVARNAIRDGDRPLVLTATGKRGLAIVAVDPVAAAEGLRPGLPLADARALVPHLTAAPADPDEDARALDRLAEWACRYSPWAATDGPDGLILDVTGCDHLFGGEAALAEEMAARLRRFKINARIGLAGAPAAAWAWARHGEGGVLPAEREAAALHALPVAALRLPPALVGDLGRLGLRTIADLAAQPPGPLTARCGEAPVRRLSQMLGRRAEPISPRRPPAEWRVHQIFADPIGAPESIARSLQHLLEALCRDLALKERGARRLVLAAYRADGEVRRLEVGVGRPVRSVRHLRRLFDQKLDRIDPGFGIDAMVLEAAATDPLPAGQMGFEDAEGGGAALAELVDRLQNRLGRDRVVRLVPVESHVPERAVTLVPAPAPAGASDWTSLPPRPVRLLPCPEPIEVTAAVPDDPPLFFRWRKIGHQVSRAEGPERIAPEWWRRDETADIRDYYWVEDTDGRRFWVYRDGAFAAGRPPRWYLHGLFA